MAWQAETENSVMHYYPGSLAKKDEALCGHGPIGAWKQGVARCRQCREKRAEQAQRLVKVSR